MIFLSWDLEYACLKSGCFNEMLLCVSRTPIWALQLVTQRDCQLQAGLPWMICVG